jgi:hypothetical protein
MGDQVISKQTVHLKSKDRIVVAGNVHYHSGNAKWYLYPRLGDPENYGAQPLIIKLAEDLVRPIQQKDRVCIETKETSHYGNVLGAFSYGLYYFTRYNQCQEWILHRSNGDGQLTYGDEFTLENCFYKSSYLQEYYSDKWKSYYLTKSETPTVWQFGKHVSNK